MRCCCRLAEIIFSIHFSFQTSSGFWRHSCYKWGFQGHQAVGLQGKISGSVFLSFRFVSVVVL